MKVSELNIKGTVKYIKADPLWDMECSEVKPYHFSIFMRTSPRTPVLLETRKVMSVMKDYGFLSDCELPLIYQPTIDELPYYFDLPEQAFKRVLDNLIPIDAHRDLMEFKAHTGLW